MKSRGVERVFCAIFRFLLFVRGPAKKNKRNKGEREENKRKQKEGIRPLLP